MERWREIRLGNIGYTVGLLLGACELPRIPLLRRWVNKGHQACLRLLVDEERALAKAVH